MIQVPTHLMFQGSTADALEVYSDVFADFRIESVEKFGEGEQGVPETINQERISSLSTKQSH